MRRRVVLSAWILLCGARVGAEPAAPPVDGPASSTKATAVRVLDRLDLDTSKITGTRELPKVLAIVPWKSDEPGPGVDQGYSTLVDEALRGVDRDVFRTETRYFEVVAAGKRDAASGPSR